MYLKKDSILCLSECLKSITEVIAHADEDIEQEK